jgi:threonine/homoserine/homoserine lactone efflux protein
MVDLSTLSLFLLAALMLFLSPGPNMAFVLSHGVAHGPRGGLAAALGIAAADLVLTLLTVTGIAALVAAWPPFFDLLRYGGAAYLLWLAVQAVRAPGRAVLTRTSHVPMATVFRMAMFNCLLNPKALLFFMVFLPQFVHAERGQMALQLTVLGLTLTAASLVFHGALGFFSGRVGAFLSGSTQAVRYQSWFLGGILAWLAVRLIMLERPAR